MIPVSRRLLLVSLLLIIVLYDGVESKRSGGRSSSSRGSSGSRSSSRGSSSSRSSSSGSSSKSSWFGSGSSSKSSSSSSWGSGSSSRSSSSGGSRSHSGPNYGSAGRSWGNRYRGNTFVVMRTHTYYRGGGYGNVYTSRSGSGTSSASVASPASSPVSEKPTVTTEMIKDVLFPGDPRIPSKLIFDFDAKNFRLRYDKYGYAENQLEVLQELVSSMINETNKSDVSRMRYMSQLGLAHDTVYEEEVKIIDEELPVIVGPIPYFWGEENLPQGDNETDCVDFSAANDASNFTICNITDMVRCQKSLSDVIAVGKDRQYTYSKNKEATIIVKTENGTVADQFAWFCPPSETCCEWECCSTVEKEHTEFDPPDDMFVSTVHMLIAVGVICIVVAMFCCCCKWISSRDEITQSASRNQQMRQQQSVEMEPLTADYPRQPRIEAQIGGGNYGWSVKPSAPPCQ